jgi:hypothetical protein
VGSEKRFSFRALFVGRGWGELAICAAAWLFAVLAAWHAARKGTGWGMALGVAVMALLFTLLPWFRRLHRDNDKRRRQLYGTVTVDDWGVTRVAGFLREAVAWEDLVWVAIQTTEEGPGAEDFFFLLAGADGKGVMVPNFIATELNLLATLQARLPGLDNEQVIVASGSTTDATFTIWKRAAPPEVPPPATAPN